MREPCGGKDGTRSGYATESAAAYLPVNVVVGLRLLAALSRQHSVVRPQPRVDEARGRRDEGDLGHVVSVDEHGRQLLLRHDHHTVRS